MKLNMKKKSLIFMIQAALIGAIYVVITYVFAYTSFGEVQVRFAEALTILPYFTPAAIPGLFIGCLISNLLVQGILIDVIGGSLVSLVAATCSYLLRKHKYLVPLPPIILNGLFVPFILYYGYGIQYLPIPLMMLFVSIGQAIACYGLGMPLLFALNKHKHVIFKQ